MLVICWLQSKYKFACPKNYHIYQNLWYKSGPVLKNGVNGKLSSLIVGIKLSIHAKSDNIITAYNIRPSCTADSYPTPSDYDIISRNRSVTIRYLPTWNKTDNYVNCDELWTYNVQSICATTFVLENSDRRRF